MDLQNVAGKLTCFSGRMNGGILIGKMINVYSEFRVSSKFPGLGAEASGWEGLNTSLDILASTRIGSTTGGAQNSELSDSDPCKSSRFLGIGGPATEGVCGSATPVGIALIRDQKGEKGREPNDFSRWRTSGF